MRRFIERAKAQLRFLTHGSTDADTKHDAEMAFWTERYRESNGLLRNRHYEYFYTTYFGIDKQEYTGRTVLDIGCGPRGSLEWADQARERVGLDPLVDRYRKLGIDAHKMKYVCAPSERIPFEDEHFDFVCSFNSLDHVDHIEKTISEISRVVKKGGNFLLITEINHPPTPTEPHTLTEHLIDQLRSTFAPIFVNLTAIRSDHDIYGSLLEGKAYTPGSERKPGILSARLVRIPKPAAC